MEKFMYERTLIYTNVELDEVIVFGIFYEFYNMIIQHNYVGIDNESLDKLVKTLFKEYITKNNKYNNYIEFYDGFLDYYLSKLHIDKNISNTEGISIKKMLGIDIRDFRDSIKKLDIYYPYLNVINKLNLSYQTKTNLIISVNEYMVYLFNMLNSFYDEDTMIRIHELVSDNILRYLSSIDTDNFDINNFNDDFELENKRYINELINKNIFNFNNINLEDEEIKILFSSLNDKEKKIFMYMIKESLYIGDINRVFSDRQEVLREMSMSNFSYKHNLRKLSKKLSNFSKMG